MTKQLYRSRENAVLGGVCGGIGEYFNIDPVIVRIVWLILLFAGVGPLIYVIAWLIIPKKPYEDYVVIEPDETDDEYK